jgi:hypothetical protein
MKRSAIRSLIVAALPLFVFVVILMSKTNKVYAALPGEDGVIVSVEVPADSTGSVTQIVATNPDTGTTTTVVTVDSENAAIESVTVSAPSGASVANQTNDVVFGQVNYTDNEDARYEIDLKKVTIDAEGNPTTSVTDLAPTTRTSGLPWPRPIHLKRPLNRKKCKAGWWSGLPSNPLNVSWHG